MLFTKIIAGSLAVSLASAHPGHDHSKEMVARREFIGRLPHRDLSHCATKIKERGLEAYNIQRRSDIAKNAMKKRGLEGNWLFFGLQSWAN